MQLHIIWDIPRGLEELHIHYDGVTGVPSNEFWQLPFYFEDFKITLPINGELRVVDFEKNSTATDVLGAIYFAYSGCPPTYFGGFTKIGNNFFVDLIE